jgi:cellulose synthase/poly-beta-1,6-N-acetylglucosamine synthase-like glycosyltransferase
VPNSVPLDKYTVGIVRRILGSACETDTEARRIVADAEAAGVEPMRRFARLAGLSNSTLYERAADAIGLPFAGAVPAAAKLKRGADSIERLKQVHWIRGTLIDRDVLFVAPGLERLAALGQRVKQQPELVRQICVVPPGRLQDRLSLLHSDALMRRALDRLAHRWPLASARKEVTGSARVAFALFAAAVVVVATAMPDRALAIVAPVLAVVYLTPALFRLAAVVAGAFHPGRERLDPLAEDRLPDYTILVPLRDEAELAEQLVHAMLAIDYPADKLDIKFVVEATSRETIEALRSRLGEGPFELVEVPDAGPGTKPKALNYALPLARGELLAIFDAEDVPEPDQLRLAAAKFEANPEIDCLQAELVIDNASENPLTALFAAEYAAQFGLVFPAMARVGLPMPLGGSSNHFRVRALIEAGGWDSYNVTEDADLGVRLARLRYRCGTLVSATYEEAPVTLGGWLRQRTRWLKGWMQTLIVHNQKPFKLLEDMGWWRMAAFELYVGGQVMTAPVHALFIALIAWRIGTGEDMARDAVSLSFAGILVLGYLAAIIAALFGLRRFGRLKLGWAQLLLPAYWILTSVAAVRAVAQLVTRPFVWEKTAHARTRLQRRQFKVHTG